MDKKVVFPLIGATIPSGLKAAEDFVRLKMGNLAGFALPADKEEARKVLRFFREHKIYMMLGEFIHRDPSLKRWCSVDLPPEEYASIFAEGGEYLVGRGTIGEVGGLLYWPREYTLDGAIGEYASLPSCDTVSGAHRQFIDFIKERLEYERTKIAPGPFINTDSSLIFPWLAEGGADILNLEMMPGDPLLCLSSIRGTAKATGKPWGVHIAICWYGGWQFDEIWLKRWKLSLYLSWMSGAQFFYPESGHYYYHSLANKTYGFHTPETKAIRRILREVIRFNTVHHRPESGPVVRFGVIHGQDDGHPGIWNPYVWGQYEDGHEWESGPAEHSWFLLRLLRRKQDPFRIELFGDRDTSGNPPDGQYDIVPAFSDRFSDYKTLIFLGYNRMDETLYRKLIRFVKEGGHLVLGLPHLNVSDVHGEIKLFQDGDLSELCGLKVTGRNEGHVRGIQFLRQPAAPGCVIPLLAARADPMYNGRIETAEVEICDPEVRILAGTTSGRGTKFTLEGFDRHPLLTERKLGKGYVWTVTAFSWPGDTGMRSFSETLLRTLTAAARTEFPDLLAPDCVRWAVYETPAGKNIYMLNTDTDLSAAVRFTDGTEKSAELRIGAADMRLAFVVGKLLMAPEDRTCALSGTAPDLTLTTREQTVFFHNFGDDPQELRINGKDIVIPAHSGMTTVIPAFLADQAEQFDDSCLEEEDFEPAKLLMS